MSCPRHEKQRERSSARFKRLQHDPKWRAERLAQTRRRRKTVVQRICITCGKFIELPQRKYCSEKCRYRRGSVAKLYSLKPLDVMTLRIRQDNACAICEVEPSEDALGRSGFQIDHDHATGKVRGLLCAGCNRGLGGFRDDVTLLTRAIEYLTSQEGEEALGG